jgi:small subunit ribosomal protein S13
MAMARIAGVTLPSNKRVIIALTYVFGIGDTQAKKILKITGVDGDIRVKDLPDAEVNKLREHIEKNMKVEGELRRDTAAHIKRLKEIGSYRGSRHAKNLPLRGQRTKTNSRTTRGNVRKTMGSGRVKAGMKT